MSIIDETAETDCITNDTIIQKVLIMKYGNKSIRLNRNELERRPMITHRSDSHQVPSQKKTKSKLQIKTNCQKFNCLNFAKKQCTRDTPSEVAW